MKFFSHLPSDVCATAENAKCPRYFTKADDGLAQVWSGRVWMNPPYGREIGAWMAKAWRSSQAGALVVCLVPARTDTARRPTGRSTAANGIWRTLNAQPRPHKPETL